MIDTICSDAFACLLVFLFTFVFSFIVIFFLISHATSEHTNIRKALGFLWLTLPSINSMPIHRWNIKHLLAYVILGLISATILSVILSISTTHWMHSKYVRVGLWKLCHLQPLTCFYSLIRSPITLAIVGLVFISIGLVSIIVFEIFNYSFSSICRYFSFLSVCSLTLAGFFFAITCAVFARLAGSFCYSYYFMIAGQLLAMLAAIGASYLQGRRNALVSTSVIMSRLAVRRP